MQEYVQGRQVPVASLRGLRRQPTGCSPRTTSRLGRSIGSKGKFFLNKFRLFFLVYYLQPIVSHTEVAVDGFLKKKKKKGLQQEKKQKSSSKK